MKVLLVCDKSGVQAPPLWASLAGQAHVVCVDGFARAAQAAADGSVEAVILPEPQPESSHPRSDFQNLLRVLEARGIATLMVCSDPCLVPPHSHPLLEPVGFDVSPSEIRGRLNMIEKYQSVVRRLEQEVLTLERLSKRLHLHFRDIDQELRLAGRLQRDFLPNTSQPIGNLRFATVYRPASWVSGDLFDIFRIDEEHCGFYIADAVGHGMAAGLLTMFLKQAIVPKKVTASGYEVLGPSDVMAALNKALIQQSLPHCQFVTASYMLVNNHSLEFEYARGGHPFPILLTDGGIVSEVKTQGGLLGLFEDEAYPAHRCRLRPGDKLIAYTDGIEHAFSPHQSISCPRTLFCDFLRQHATLDIQSLMTALDRHLDQQIGSLYPPDDISVLGLEVV